MFDLNERGIQEVVKGAAMLMEALGVFSIVAGSFFAGARFLWVTRKFHEEAYAGFRSGLGRAILLGLELLVAADIIRTVAVEPSFRSVGVLGIVVIIRTFLSFSLEVEISGRWPWQEKKG
jgi:uncharacterized membrane protein